MATRNPILRVLVATLIAGCTPGAIAPTQPAAGTPAPTATAAPTDLPTDAPTDAPTDEPTEAASATPDVMALPDPCVLVTKEEAETATGAALADGMSELFSRPDDTLGRSCYYDAATGPGSLNVHIWTATEDQAALYRMEQQMFGDIEDVAGVGDEAYRVGWTSLVVRQGDTMLEFGIEMVDYDPDSAQEELRTLAEGSLDRL